MKRISVKCRQGFAPNLKYVIRRTGQIGLTVLLRFFDLSVICFIQLYSLNFNWYVKGSYNLSLLGHMFNGTWIFFDTWRIEVLRVSKHLQIIVRADQFLIALFILRGRFWVGVNPCGPIEPEVDFVIHRKLESSHEGKSDPLNLFKYLPSFVI
jgi:hypothetical protein